MPVGTVTFTGPIGPAFTLTARVFPGAKIVTWKLDEEVLQIEQALQTGPKVTDLDIASITTVTHTITAGVHSITVT